MKQYPKLRRPGHSSVDGLLDHEKHRLIITEKHDGSNFRFCRDGDGIRFGSRNVDLGVDPDTESVPPSTAYRRTKTFFNTLRMGIPSVLESRLYGGYDPNTPKMFRDTIDYVNDVVDPDDLRELEERYEACTTCEDVSLVLFGEAGIQHTIDEYHWESVPQFQLFDVWIECENDDGCGGTWCQWSITDGRKQAIEAKGELLDDDGLDFYFVEDIANHLGLETVPVIEETTVSELDLRDFNVPESVYRTDGGPAEGVVIRNPTTGQKAKYISEEFAERHGSAKAGSKAKHPIEAETRQENIDSFIATYVTDRRIEKNIQKLLEDPSYDYEDVEMEMMADLHSVVWKDVWEEDLEEIIFERYTLDIKQAHNQAANKCANRVQTLMQANETPVTVVDPEDGRVVGEA